MKKNINYKDSLSNNTLSLSSVTEVLLYATRVRTT